MPTPSAPKEELLNQIFSGSCWLNGTSLYFPGDSTSSGQLAGISAKREKVGVILSVLNGWGMCHLPWQPAFSALTPVSWRNSETGAGLGPPFISRPALAVARAWHTHMHHSSLPSFTDHLKGYDSLISASWRVGLVTRPSSKYLS